MWGVSQGWGWHRRVGGTAQRQLQRLVEPIDISGARTKPAAVRVLRREEDGATVVEVQITEGKNRQIRRLCGRSGLGVLSLTRVRLGPMDLACLPEGQARFVSETEVTAARLAVAGHNNELGDHAAKPEPEPQLEPEPEPEPTCMLATWAHEQSLPLPSIGSASSDSLKFAGTLLRKRLTSANAAFLSCHGSLGEDGVAGDVHLVLRTADLGQQARAAAKQLPLGGALVAVALLYRTFGGTLSLLVHTLNATAP